MRHSSSSPTRVALVSYVGIRKATGAFFGSKAFALTPTLVSFRGSIRQGPASGGGHFDQRLSQIAGLGKGIGKENAPEIVPADQVNSVRIDAGQAPVAVLVRAGEGPRIDGNRVAMLVVHVVNRRLFRFCKRGNDRRFRDEIAAVQEVSFSKPAIQACSARFKPEEGEVAESDIELCLRMPVQVAALGAGSLRAFPFPA